MSRSASARQPFDQQDLVVELDAAEDQRAAIGRPWDTVELVRGRQTGCSDDSSGANPDVFVQFLNGDVPVN